MHSELYRCLLVCVLYLAPTNRRSGLKDEHSGIVANTQFVQDVTNAGYCKRTLWLCHPISFAYIKSYDKDKPKKDMRMLMKLRRKFILTVEGCQVNCYDTADNCGV